MLPLGELPVVSEMDELMDPFVELGDAGRWHAVVIHDHRFVGLLSLADVERVIAEVQRSKAGRPVEARPGAPRVSEE